MEKRQTPRSRPSRAPWFDKEDVRRIAARTDQFFKMCGFNQGPPRDVTHFTFSPYILGGHDGDLFKQMTKLSVRRGKDFDPERALRYLKYLGFDDRFTEAYIDAQRDQGNPQLGPLYTNDASFASWFGYLYARSGEDLREILAPIGNEKWRRRLTLTKTTWKTLRLTREAMAAITDLLFTKHFPAIFELDRSGWIKRLQRWEAAGGRPLRKRLDKSR